MKILIVDDEKTMIETLRRGLRTRGFQVFDAPNGMDALAFLGADNEVDMVITDYAMPRMDGMELLKEIRRTSDVPVILMTAYGDKDVVVEAMKNRCSGFIDKPFTLENLLEEIDRTYPSP